MAKKDSWLKREALDSAREVSDFIGTSKGTILISATLVGLALFWFGRSVAAAVMAWLS